MIADFYINFKAKKKYGSLELSGAPKTSIKKPSTGSDEVCVRMTIELPDHLFEKPILAIVGKIESDFTKENAITLTQQAKEIIEKKLKLRCDIVE